MLSDISEHQDRRGSKGIKSMSISRCLIVCAMVIALCNPAQSTVLNWQLQGSFDDGDLIWGQFRYDDVLDVYSDIQIFNENGINPGDPFAPLEYSATEPSFEFRGSDIYLYVYRDIFSDLFSWMEFSFDVPLSHAAVGDMIAGSANEWLWEVDFLTLEITEFGPWVASVRVVAIPEPGSPLFWMLFTAAVGFSSNRSMSGSSE